jgi:hypothetical protein
MTQDHRESRALVKRKQMGLVGKEKVVSARNDGFP